MNPAERAKATAKQRRRRARQRRGEAVVLVTVSRDVIEALIDLGWLLVEQSEDPRKVGASVSDLLAAMAWLPAK